MAGKGTVQKSLDSWAARAGGEEVKSSDGEDEAPGHQGEALTMSEQSVSAGQEAVEQAVDVEQQLSQ